MGPSALKPEPADATWLPLHKLDRRYPARADAQRPPRDKSEICSRCLSGGCCNTEGPIALTPYDVLRLAAALALSPTELLERFTQDRFEGPDGPRYAAWLDDPDNSVVSFLRRRTLDAASPCIFLKYIREFDGTPRRVCSVHPARPLACREYYHDTCTTRWTGEMAALEAIGYEALRDGTLDAETVQARWRACGPRRADDSLAQEWQRTFWSEMRRALQPERANIEGAFDRRLAELQDPLDIKVNRLLSTLRLRFEEKYGPEPLAEQRHGFDAGLALASGPERDRLMALVAQPAGAEPLHGADGLRLHLGHRALLAPAVAIEAELLRLSARCGRQGPTTQRQNMAALHLALSTALTRWHGAGRGGRAGLKRAANRHARWALAFCRSDLENPETALAAADGLAQLVHLGFFPAVSPLSAWRRRAAGLAARQSWGAWRRRLGRDPALLLAGAPLALMLACEPRASLRWLAGRWADRRWTAQAGDVLLAWLDRSLRLPGFDPAWIEAAPPTGALKQALDAWRRESAVSIWDAPLAAVGDLWHDDYVLRAIDRAGLRSLEL